MFVRLYTQYVRPHLEFSAPAWSPWQEGDKACLESVQRRAIAMVTGLRSRVYEDRLAELGLTTLEERRHQLDMIQVYKILNQKDDVNKDTWFKMAADGGRSTRAAEALQNIRIPVNQHEFRRNFFSQRVPGPWNRVPDKIKRLETVNAFKNAYKAHRRAIE